MTDAPGGHCRVECPKCKVVILQCKCFDCARVITYRVCEKCTAQPKSIRERATEAAAKDRRGGTWTGSWDPITYEDQQQAVELGFTRGYLAGAAARDEEMMEKVPGAFNLRSSLTTPLSVFGGITALEYSARGGEAVTYVIATLARMGLFLSDEELANARAERDQLQMRVKELEADFLAEHQAAVDMFSKYDAMRDEREQLQARVNELKKDMTALAKIATRCESDRDYNAELVKERDQDITQLQAGLKEALILVSLTHTRACTYDRGGIASEYCSCDLRERKAEHVRLSNLLGEKPDA